MFFVTIIKSTVSNSMFLKGITWFSMLLPLLVSIKDPIIKVGLIKHYYGNPECCFMHSEIFAKNRVSGKYGEIR